MKSQNWNLKLHTAELFNKNDSRYQPSDKINRRHHSNEIHTSNHGRTKVNQIERKLLSLPAEYGGLAVPIFAEISDDEYKSNSLIISEHLRNKIIQQQHEYTADHDTKTAKI